MPFLRADLSHFRWDVGGLSKARTVAITKVIKEAGREWLSATLEYVPTLTGMSRGSLRPLGAFLDMHVPIDPTSERRDRGPTEGSELGTPKEDIFTIVNGRFSFRFESRVWWYWLNEFHNRAYGPDKQETPWQSFERGKEAFQQYLGNNMLKRLPRLSRYREKITVSSGHHGRFPVKG